MWPSSGLVTSLPARAEIGLAFRRLAHHGPFSAQKKHTPLMGGAFAVILSGSKDRSCVQVRRRVGLALPGLDHHAEDVGLGDDPDHALIRNHR